MSTLMSGARMLLECLSREGVDCMFGYPGGVTLPLYDVLYDHPLRHVLVRHEENAAFAADVVAAGYRSGLLTGSLRMVLSLAAATRRGSEPSDRSAARISEFPAEGEAVSLFPSGGRAAADGDLRLQAENGRDVR